VLDNANLKLVAAARNLYAHLNQTIVKLTDEQIDDHLLENCRRAAALLQACLLRDLDIEATKAHAMFEEHDLDQPPGEGQGRQGQLAAADLRPARPAQEN
jgi:hypothetical protein